VYGEDYDAAEEAEVAQKADALLGFRVLGFRV
jgi:hypothetical protein